MQALSNSAVATIERFKQQHVAATIPTSLATFLYIYTHASHECYIDYMAGARVLASYLAPIDLCMDTHLDMDRVSLIIPDLLVSYELMELAKVLQPHTTAPHNISTHQIEYAIYEYLITKSR